MMAFEALDAPDTHGYERFVNPAWLNTVRLAGLDMKPVRASGSWIHLDDGRDVLDFVTGYGAMPLGHHPPALLERLFQDLGSPLPNLNPLGISEDAGVLAEALIEWSGIAGGKVYFGGGGVDAVEAALKFSMVHTGRAGVVTFEGGFHGLSITATALAGSGFWRRGLPAPPSQFHQCPLGDVDAVRKLLAFGDIAAVLLEPVQGSAGAYVWAQDDLTQIAEACSMHGAVLIFDEILSGIARTGHGFAYQTLNVPAPQLVLAAKGLTGGVLPVSAVIMEDAIYRSVFGREHAAKIHGSTFGGNRLAMRCGAHVLSILQQFDIASNVRRQGERLGTGIDRLGAPFGLSCDGLGLLRSIRATPECMRAFGNDAAFRLWRALLDENVLTIPAAHDPASLRLLPPLNVTAADIDHFLHAFSDALHVAFRTTGATTYAGNHAR